MPASLSRASTSAISMTLAITHLLQLAIEGALDARARPRRGLPHLPPHPVAPRREPVEHRALRRGQAPVLHHLGLQARFALVHAEPARPAYPRLRHHPVIRQANGAHTLLHGQPAFLTGSPS